MLIGARPFRHLSTLPPPGVRRTRRPVEAVAATSSYRELIDPLERRIRESQARAAKALNTELVMLYWSIGHDILAEQQASGWGEDIVGRIAEDLRVETGSARGFHRAEDRQVRARVRFEDELLSQCRVAQRAPETASEDD
jgi:hypothetical protein